MIKSIIGLHTIIANYFVHFIFFDKNHLICQGIDPLIFLKVLYKTEEQ